MKFKIYNTPVKFPDTAPVLFGVSHESHLKPKALFIRPKIPKFSKRGQMVAFNRKFPNFRNENQMERKFPGKISKIGVHLRRLSSLSGIILIHNFLFSASFFGHDPSEIGISRKNNGDTYSKMDQYLNFRILPPICREKLASVRRFITSLNPLNPLSCNVFAAVGV